MVATIKEAFSLPITRASIGGIIVYILVIGFARQSMPAVNQVIHGHAAENRNAEQNSMGWTDLTLSQADIPANPNGTWTWAHEYIEGPALLKIEVKDDSEGKPQDWQYAPGKRCAADGDRNASTQARNCIMPDAPVGALIAKIGGSTAGSKDGKLYLVGRMALVSLDQNTSGPLFFTINSPVGGLKDNADKLTVSVSISIPPSGSKNVSSAAASTSASSSGAASPAAKEPGSADSAADTGD